ncbi:hypothetical protein UPYG_G00205990 [Umbra pygmaea]|uniref:Uncharacterized protein n=1 Tax=Umbra pygmaea TaxID=75934 RepID=A0ABD0X5A8_UMBPY
MWISFIIISHLGQHWIIQRSSLNFWTALNVKGLNNFARPICLFFICKKSLKYPINSVPLHDFVLFVVASSQKITVLYLYV